jgi:hypothetical protein
MTPQKPVCWTLLRFENGCAVLENQGKELVVSRSQVPDTCKEGDVLTAEFYLLKDDKKRKENLARALLEEILGK